MKKHLAIFLAVTLLLLTLGGCSKKPEQGGEVGEDPKTEVGDQTEGGVVPDVNGETEAEVDIEDAEGSETEAETESIPEIPLVEYGLWIGDVRVTSRNQTDVLGDGTVIYEGNGAEGTLTLRNARVQTIHEFVEEMDDSTGICSKIPHLTLVLEGDNRIGGGTVAPLAGFSAYDLTITGDGSLSTSGGKFGLVAEDVTLLSGTVTALAIECAEASMNVGFAAFGNLSVLDGEINGIATMAMSDMSYGVMVFEELYFESGLIEAEHIRGGEGFPAIFFSKIRYAEGYWPLIRAGMSVSSNKTVDDYATYTYTDGYISIR